MLRLSTTAFGNTRPWVKDRATLRNVQINVPFDMDAETKLVFRLHADHVVMSQHSVSPWADVREVFGSAARPLPETYPLGRLAFVKQNNVYNDADFFRKLSII